jgi:hypothetical protein
MTPAFPSNEWRHARLAEPKGPVRVVIDTDAANEIDDQFALAWALLSAEALCIEALHAAPFSFAHRRAQLARAPADSPPFNPPAEGMWRSHGEILRVLDKLGGGPHPPVRAGSEGYLPGAAAPLQSPAAEHLIALARSSTDDAPPLYVLVLGCPTNVASALLLAPDIARRIVVVWTSGYPSCAPHVNESFNLEQDPHASRVLLESGVPLVYLPGFHVGAQLRLSLAEVDRHVRGQGAIGDYLHHLFTHNPLWTVLPVDTSGAYSWVIWDLICVAWLLDPAWVPSTLVPTPRLAGDLRWQAAAQRLPMREAHAVDRDAIFNDLFRKLAHHAGT